MLFRDTVFLTGFPGFIAGRLVERLARSDRQFILLVQPQLIEQAMSDVDEIARRADVPLECFSLVEGDITQPDLGIAADDLETIRFETKRVFHLAAVYDLAIDRSTAMAVNLEGTRNVNALVRTIRDLERYNYVSTCYVAGRREGTVLETELEHNSGFKNFYEESKYLAEAEVEKIKADVPLTIYRPSVVVGDSETGETVKYDGIYYLINYLRKAPTLLRVINVGNDRVRLNLVPVDFVVDAIAELSANPAAAGKTLAIADRSPMTTSELFNAIAYDLTGRRSEFTPSPRLVEWFLNTPVSPPITGLPRYGVPYFFISQSYDTSIADGLLKQANIECPRFSEYVGSLLDFVAEFPEL